MRTSCLSLFSLSLAGILCPALGAHESANLRPGDGFPGARGEARIGGDEIRVRGDWVPRNASIAIWIAGEDGVLVQTFTTATESDGSFDVRDSVDQPGTFAGRAIEVRDADGKVILSGEFPRAADAAETGTGAGALDPPVGSPLPNASGRIRVKASQGRHLIEIRIRGLQYYGVYSVSVVNLAGESEVIGSITGKGSGNGALKIDTGDGGSLPFGAAGIQDLVGFGVQVKDAPGLVLLEGEIPALGQTDIHPEERQQEIEFDLARPSDSPDQDILGDANIQEEIGEDDKIRVRIKKNGEANKVYSVTAVKPDSGLANEQISKITTDSRGEGEALARGRGVFPFGAKSLSELGGVLIEVSDSQGRLVLRGAIPQVGSIPNPPPAPVERLSLAVTLSRPDPALDPDANGKVELEEEEDEHELEIEVEDIAPGAAYRVELRDLSNAAEVLAEGPADSLGNLRSKVTKLGAEPLPFGASSFRAYDGYLILVLDASGAVVLQGQVAIPGGGGAALAPPVAFTMVGDYDAPFLRGDANRDSALNLTDAINTLEVLFLGRQQPACLDAMDTNDDGEVDIADPITTLVHLFVGSVELPYPGSRIYGFDVTADNLSCRDP